MDKAYSDVLLLVFMVAVWITISVIIIRRSGK